MSSPPDHRAESVLVIGAGELGSAVLNALANRDESGPGALALAVRRPTSELARHRVTDATAAGIDVVEVDVAAASVTELAAIMGGYDTVVSCVGMAAGPGTQVKLARAALDGAVPRFVPWQFGVDYDVIGRGSPQNLFDEQLDVRDLLRGQDDTGWVIVSTGMFTSFAFEPTFGVVDLANATVNALGDMDNEVTLTTPEDIGTLVATIVYAEPRIVNTVVFVAGDTVTYRAMADVVEEVRGIPVTRSTWTLPYLVDEARRHPEDAMAKYRAVFAGGTGVAWPKSRTFNVERGIPTTTAAQWARAHLRPPDDGDV